MTDGGKLVADAWHPARGGPWPVLLQRLPYGRTVASAPVLPHPVQLARAGYAVIAQDVRGRGDSGGQFDPFVNEGADGAATIEWAATLPFCDGQVATYGFSYQGISQLLAAQLRPPALRAIAPMQCAPSAYEGWTYTGGCLQLPFVAPWAAQLAGQEPGVTPPAVDLTSLPLRSALGDTPPRWYSDWLAHDTDDGYWQDRRADVEHITVPAFSVGGWHDTFAAATCHLVADLNAEAVLGPWGHMPWGTRLGGHELGPEAGPQTAHARLLAFFDRVLKGRGDPPAAPIRYFTGGIGWRDAARWPAPSAETVIWSGLSGGHANSRHGDGRLEPIAADGACSDVVASEPLVPYPGALDPLSEEGSSEDRRDVLCYTSAPLRRPVIVTGSPTLEIVTSADVDSHDVVASLTMVDPSNRSIRLATGVMRLRAIVPGSSVTTIVELSPTSWFVPAGHRLRLDVSASRFPAFDRNPQNAGVRSHLAGRRDCRVGLIEVHSVRLAVPTEPG